jgi:hydroxymethylpyrimidine pyrophosphatase-like HAD family hydrolase
VNGWFGTYDKLAMTLRMARECFAVELDREREHYIFIGDSPNDAPMFGYFPHAIGVANVRDFESELVHRPTYVAGKRCGAGFRECVDFLLASK